MVMKLLFGLFLLSLALTNAFSQTAILERTQKVSLIFVGPSKGVSESSFGHVALKLSPNEVPGITDSVVEFVANIPENENPAMKYLKGIGVGASYPVVASVQPFYNYKKIKSIGEDRNVRVLELKLSKDEVRSVISFIDNFQLDPDSEDYAFFTKNCSYFSALAIEKAIKRKMGIKSFPWKVPEKLHALKLVEKDDTYEAASLERVRLTKRAIERDRITESFPTEAWGETFSAMFGEFSFVFRQSSYLKLLSVLNRPEVPEEMKKKVNSLLRYLLSQETDSDQYVLKSLFKESDKKSVIELRPIHLERPLPGNRNRVRHELIVKKTQVFLKLEGEDLPITDLLYNEATREISYKAHPVGRFIKTKTDQLILTEALDYGLSYDEKELLLTPFIYVDFSNRFPAPVSTYQSLRPRGVLALNNATDFKGELGSCYAMALLQKAMVERTVFLPALKRDEKLDKLRVLDQVYNGSFAFIAGFSDIGEFTRSIDKTQLKDFIRQKQKLLEKSTVSQFIENLRYRTEINGETIGDLRALLAEGIIVPMMIGMLEKGTKKLATSAGHVVLVFSVQEVTDGYRLTAYDPNTGLNTLFVLDRNYKLQYPFYDKKYDYFGVIDRLLPDAIQLDHAVRSRTFNTSVLQTDYVSSPQNIFMFLK